MNQTITNNITQPLTLQELLGIKSEKELLHSLTDSLWEEYFNLLKQQNVPSADKKLKRTVNTRIMNRNWNMTGGGTKCLDEYYVDEINEKLDIMRGKYKSEGVVGAVYHIRHIKDLLRFEPGMHSRFVNDDGFTYFEVWL